MAGTSTCAPPRDAQDVGVGPRMHSGLLNLAHPLALKDFVERDLGGRLNLLGLVQGRLNLLHHLFGDFAGTAAQRIAHH